MPRILVFFAALLLCVPVQAQRRKPARASAPAASDWPLETVTVTGNSNYSTEAILRVAGLKTGQRVAPKDIEAARDRIQDSGVFESVGLQFAPAADGKGYDVTFQVVETGPFFPVRFEDLNAPADELRAALAKSDPLFTGKIPATVPVLTRYSRVLEEYLASKGKPQDVGGKLTNEGADSLGVLFRPAAAPPAIARVVVTGTEAIDNTDVVRSLADVAVGVRYTDRRFRELLDSAVRPLYESRGRVRVSFADIKTEKAKDVEGLIVSVRVIEGPVYNLGDVIVTGTDFSPADIKKIGAFKSGEPFNADQIKASAVNFEKALRRAGYMEVTEKTNRTVKDADKTVDVAIAFSKGPQYVFGKLNIEGLDIQSEPAIRKMWGLQPGKPFNAEYPDIFLNRVREDGVFEKLGKTAAKVSPRDQNHTVDVTLVFSPVPPEKPDKRERRERF